MIAWILYLWISGRNNFKDEALGLFLKKAQKVEIPPNTFIVFDSMSKLIRNVPIVRNKTNDKNLGLLYLNKGWFMKK